MRDAESRRIERVYEGYMRDPQTRRRWSSRNAGNSRIDRERERVAAKLLERAGLWPPAGYRILDVGCGFGHVLRRFIASGAREEDCVGIDLMANRLAGARGEPGGPRLVRADGLDLPFPEATFQVVVVFTVFSSILDDSVALQLAAEIDRVLVRRGSVLWYDFRAPNPRNPNTRRMGRRRIAHLFSGYRMEPRSVTLVPQLARHLGPLTPVAYPMLASIPWTRTHYLALLTKR